MQDEPGRCAGRIREERERGVRGRSEEPGLGFRTEVASSVAILTFRFESHGSEGSVHWNATEVYVRIVDGWRIVHTHSEPHVNAVQAFRSQPTSGLAGYQPFGPVPRWASSQPSIASVDGSGNVTALASGATLLSVTFHGSSDTRQLRVVPWRTFQVAVARSRCNGPVRPL